VSSVSSGGRLAFSPDGTKIAFAGDYQTPGIYTVPVAGGDTTQLTSDLDYWPSYSANGSKLFFSRDAGSDNADDNAARPVASSSDEDVYELWTVKKDGSGEAVIAQGNFQDLAVGLVAASSAPGAAAPSP